MRSYFVIEEDSSTIEIIEHVLQDFGQFHFLGSTCCPETAMEIILKDKPDLVFIRIDHILEDPFKFVSELQFYLHHLPRFIAISNSKDRAYTAFKYNFQDYLLSPLTALEVRKSILRHEKNNPVGTSLICIKSYKDYRYLNSDNILFLKADNNTTDFHLEDGRVIGAFKTLKTYENRLPGNFLRVHKSYIINATHVSRIHYGKAICTLGQYKQPIPFTRTFEENIARIHYILNRSSY
ncbi:LytR/AlgR family response regulator transcription factor [Sinomicrobium weinanense]|uniref:LytTR family transcriptional regulator DNA-binding domain-containing protein n=1 Tax=Sinomicrobium weinanense TaxID=2842200 RepID=A0A926JPT2_9FLAO|nr:LytTR family transcriptional regulator DNA-binding domain-containing protein [Sinomicrobium weinanense]MBC9795136.1 LytTR family transcriptional regulator DNA-binding domain-containing protein [Sinomicrobium weinanense]MBU3123732.1 LytTR family transcriptional regulator DNA-binding domain-containing protein [Sinomicrobium weinanense]